MKLFAGNICIILLSIIMKLNSQELVMQRLCFKTNALGPAEIKTGAVMMTVWLDGIIYQCEFPAPIPISTETCCDSPSAIGHFCDDLALNGQLLIENNQEDDYIIIDEISMFAAPTASPTTVIEYGITGWCVDQSVPTEGLMQDGGFACPSPTPGGNTLACWISLTNICDTSFEGQNLVNYHTICISNNDCAPGIQKMFFNLDSSMALSTDVEWEDGSNTPTASETCDPTIDPTSDPTNDPTMATNNPTSDPTKDPTDSSDSSGDSGSDSAF